MGNANNEPLVPWLVSVNVPPFTSSGCNFLERARLARSLTAPAIVSREWLPELLMTGTIKPSSPSEVAMPILIFLWIKTPSSLQDELTIGYALSPSTIADMKYAVNVRLTPSFSNAALFAARCLETRDISASITVSTCGEVCFDSTICCAMDLRMTVCLMKRSPALEAATPEWVMAVGLAGTPLWMKFQTSFLVIRPLH